MNSTGDAYMEMLDLGVALDRAEDLSGALELGMNSLTCELINVASQGTRQLPPAPDRERLLLALGGAATLLVDDAHQTLLSGMLVALSETSGLELQCEGVEPFEALLITTAPNGEAS